MGVTRNLYVTRVLMFMINKTSSLRGILRLCFYYLRSDGASENEGALETIRRLETNKHIQEDNISTLFGAIKEIGRSDLIKKLQIYQDNYKEACVNQPDEETMNNKRPRSSYDEFEYKQGRYSLESSSLDPSPQRFISQNFYNIKKSS